MARIWASAEEGRDADDYEADMPPLTGAAYLVRDLFNPGEAGITVAGAMGEGPLTHTAIRHWMENTGTRRSPWECRALIRASFEYLAAKGKATKQDAPPPWNAEMSDGEMHSVGESLRNTLRRLAGMSST